MNKKFGATLFRSSRSQIFFKIGLFKNFAIFIEKNFSWSLFLIKLHSWRLATWLKRDSHAGIFCEYWEICKSNVFVEHLRWLLLMFIVKTCHFKFQINKRVLLIEMMKVSSSRSKFIIKNNAFLDRTSELCLIFEKCFFMGKCRKIIISVRLLLKLATYLLDWCYQPVLNLKPSAAWF